jgi:type II secretory pathway pseudopilin PulG
LDAIRGRKGFALAAAILAVVLIGGLVAGVLFVTTEETRAGEVEADREIALNACDAAIAIIVSGSARNLPDSIGVDATIATRSVGAGPDVIVYTTRLDSRHYWVLAESVPKAGGGSAHRVGVVVRASVSADGSITIDPISEHPWFELF